MVIYHQYKKILIAILEARDFTNINKVQKDRDENIVIEILEDDKPIKQYKNVVTPILMINNKIVSNGKILTDKEIKYYIKFCA